jgi:hypothetical protein
MKIRQGFVTNSSATSFLISFKGEFNYNDFMKGLGLENIPDWLDMLFRKLFQDLDKSLEGLDETLKSYGCKDIDEFFDRQMRQSNSKEIVRELLSRNRKVYCGYFSDDPDVFPLEGFFCRQSIVVINDDLFFDASQVSY